MQKYRHHFCDRVIYKNVDVNNVIISCATAHISRIVFSIHLFFHYAEFINEKNIQKID